MFYISGAKLRSLVGRCYLLAVVQFNVVNSEPITRRTNNENSHVFALKITYVNVLL